MTYQIITNEAERALLHARLKGSLDALRFSTFIPDTIAFVDRVLLGNCDIEEGGYVCGQPAVQAEPHVCEKHQKEIADGKLFVQ